MNMSTFVSALIDADQSRTLTLNFLTLQSIRGNSCWSPMRTTRMPSISAVSSSRFTTPDCFTDCLSTDLDIGLDLLDFFVRVDVGPPTDLRLVEGAPEADRKSVV